MKRVFLILVLVLIFGGIKAQKNDTSDITFGVIHGNDTIIHREIKQIVVFPERKFDNKRQRRRYNRYMLKVKKVYPLAVEAKKLLEKYEPQYYALDNQKDRRKLMKNLEKELLTEHKEELKKWSISDGRILLKLIDRETERTPYVLIKDFRGDVSAVFWQGIARLFKNDLKDEYDPYDEDKMLEEIVSMIELGYL